MLILERFEGSVAVIEDGDRHIEVNSETVAENAREGDVLKINGGRYEVDGDATEKRRRKISKLQNSLWG